MGVPPVGGEDPGRLIGNRTEPRLSAQCPELDGTDEPVSGDAG